MFKAGLLFLPCGVLFGYNLFLLTALYDEFRLVIPHIIAAVSALLLSLVIRILKMNRLVFYHFYVLLVSSIIMTIGGLFIIYGNGKFWNKIIRLVKNNYKFLPELIGVSLGSVSFGLIFIAGLNYIYIRAKTEIRNVKLSLCHLWFLFGIGLTWTITAENELSNFQNKNAYVGGIIAGFSIFVAILIITNELLNVQHDYNYKESLDPDVNRENAINSIFHKKNFQITYIKQAKQLYLDKKIWTSKTWSPKKQYWSSIAVVLMKVRGLFVFYYPYYLLSIILGSLNFGFDLLWINYWFPVIGALLGTIVIRFTSPKLLFLSSSIFQIVFLVILTVSYEHGYSLATEICLCFLLITFGASYSTADILILDSASLRNSELFLAFGFIIEMILIALIQVVTVVDSSLNPFSIPINMFMFFSLFIPVFLVPNNFHRTILQIRNTLNGYTNEDTFYQNRC